MKFLSLAFQRCMFALVPSIPLIGCTSTAHKAFHEKNYTLGSAITVKSGSLIANEVNGEVRSKRNWVGIMKSKDGWGEARLEFSDDYTEKKLFYLGTDLPKIFLMYRKYIQGSPKPAVEEIKGYDVSETPFVQINEYNLELAGLEDPMESGNVQATFYLLDNQSWLEKQREHSLALKKRQEEEELQSLEGSCSRLLSEADAAKDYVLRFAQGVSGLNAFRQAMQDYDELKASFSEIVDKNIESRDRIRIYGHFNSRLKEILLGLRKAKTVVENWTDLNQEIKEASSLGIGKGYLKMALDFKAEGERALISEDLDDSIQLFSEAREEIARVVEQFQRLKSN